NTPSDNPLKEKSRKRMALTFLDRLVDGIYLSGSAIKYAGSWNHAPALTPDSDVFIGNIYNHLGLSIPEFAFFALGSLISINKNWLEQDHTTPTILNEENKTCLEYGKIIGLDLAFVTRYLLYKISENWANFREFFSGLKNGHSAFI